MACPGGTLTWAAICPHNQSPIMNDGISPAGFLNDWNARLTSADGDMPESSQSSPARFQASGGSNSRGMRQVGNRPVFFSKNFAATSAASISDFWLIAQLQKELGSQSRSPA